MVVFKGRVLISLLAVAVVLIPAWPSIVVADQSDKNWNRAQLAQSKTSSDVWRKLNGAEIQKVFEEIGFVVYLNRWNFTFYSNGSWDAEKTFTNPYTAYCVWRNKNNMLCVEVEGIDGSYILMYPPPDGCFSVYVDQDNGAVALSKSGRKDDRVVISKSAWGAIARIESGKYKQEPSVTDERVADIVRQEMNKIRLEQERTRQRVVDAAREPDRSNAELEAKNRQHANKKSRPVQTVANDGFRKLTGSEIQRVFEDLQDVNYPDDKSRVNADDWIGTFKFDGSWEATTYGGRLNTWGTWSVEGNQLCVTMKGGETGLGNPFEGCFTIHVDLENGVVAANIPELKLDHFVLKENAFGAIARIKTTTTNQAAAIKNESVNLSARREKKLRSSTGKTDPNIAYGTYHALVIGINDYKSLPKLKTALIDARAVAVTLKEYYGYRVQLLENPTRVDIIDALDLLRQTLTENDNLLIYYAGHGYLDRNEGRGYWLPVNAKQDWRSRWFANDDLTSAIKAMFANNVMVVSDSCYSGTLTRGIKQTVRTPDFLRRMAESRTRVVLSSGGLEPVVDAGGGKHSVFAAQFLKALRENKAVMDGVELFQKVREDVMLNAKQTPQYSNIRFAGHEGGDFLFVRTD